MKYFVEFESRILTYEQGNSPFEIKEEDWKTLPRKRMIDLCLVAHIEENFDYNDEPYGTHIFYEFPSDASGMWVKDSYENVKRLMQDMQSKYNRLEELKIMKEI